MQGTKPLRAIVAAIISLPVIERVKLFPMLRNAAVGTESGYSDYSSVARAQEAGDHGDVCSGGYRYSA
jgi:hypothetical protein